MLEGRRKVALIVLLGGGSLAAIAVAFSWGDWERLLQNLTTGMIGAGLTYLLLKRILRSLEEKHKRRKANLTKRMGSRLHNVAMPAAEELGEEGWLTDGYLKGAHLGHANLWGTNLWGANLEGAILWGAKLQRAYLGNANLQRAHLQEAYLVATYLKGAHLGGAHLQGANLRGARLQEANLESVTLDRGTNITDAQLAQAASIEGAYCLLEGSDD